MQMSTLKSRTGVQRSRSGSEGGIWDEDVLCLSRREHLRESRFSLLREVLQVCFYFLRLLRAEVCHRQPHTFDAASGAVSAE